MRLELKPFNVKVVTVITGSVESNIFVNAPEHHLPPGSLYAKAEKEIASRATGVDVNQHSKREDFARALVGDIVGGANGLVYRGKMSSLVRMVTSYLPIAMIVSLSCSETTNLDSYYHMSNHEASLVLENQMLTTCNRIDFHPWAPDLETLAGEPHRNGPSRYKWVTEAKRQFEMAKRTETNGERAGITNVFLRLSRE